MSDTKTVDSVLADIWHRGLCTENVRDFEAARAAFAELIEASRKISDADAYARMYAHLPDARDDISSAWQESLDGLNAALRACGGA
jgi:hypothetical protein